MLLLMCTRFGSTVGSLELVLAGEQCTVYMVQRCQPPPPPPTNGHGSDKYPPPPLWLWSCGWVVVV